MFVECKLQVSLTVHQLSPRYQGLKERESSGHGILQNLHLAMPCNITDDHHVNGFLGLPSSVTANFIEIKTL